MKSLCRRNGVPGFTLIELSIVLIVIGLIVGGVLAGRNLIETAKLRAVISQIERYKVAVTTFRVKYDALPGDMANATDYWPFDLAACIYQNPGVVTNTCNGTGAGVIGSANINDPNFGANHFETFLVWNHLSLAHFIEGTYGPMVSNNVYGYPGSNIPASIGQSGIELMYAATGIADASPKAGTAGHPIFVLGTQPPSNVMFGQEAGTYGGRGVSSSQAYYIDSKMDDGLPYSGGVTGTWEGADACGNSLSGQGTGVYSYLMQNAIVQGYPNAAQGCALFFNAGF